MHYWLVNVLSRQNVYPAGIGAHKTHIMFLRAHCFKGRNGAVLHGDIYAPEVYIYLNISCVAPHESHHFKTVHDSTDACKQEMSSV